MENLLFSFNMVAPTFILVFLGWFLKKIGIIDDRFVDTASKLNFKAGFSSLLFINIYQADITKIIDWKFVSYLCGGILSICLILCIIVPFIVKDKRKASAIIHTAFKPNIIILAFPIAQTMFGAEHMGAMSMVLPFLIIADNVVGVIMLSAFDEENSGGNGRFKSTLLSLLKNPIILAAVAAIFLQALKIQLPVFLTKSVTTLSGMAIPLALITLGAQMKVSTAAKNLKYSLPAAIIRVFVSPVILVSLAVMLGFSGNKLAVILLVSGSPTAVNSYVLAKEMHSDEKLTGEVVLLTTLFSIFTMFFGIYFLKQLALI